MKAFASHGTAGLGGLRLVDLDDPGAPGPGEVRVRIHASSLNYHDLGVATGHMHAPDGRIPMVDGAGVVEAIGAGVEEFAVGDHVVERSWLPGGLPELASHSRSSFWRTYHEYDSENCRRRAVQAGA
jgi:NADPH:quinone reductase-like Zn-dependent oxidoreductase